MAKLPIPDIAVETVFELTSEFLRGRDIELLLVDLDNTLACYSQEQPTREIEAWVRSLKDAGIRLHIVSNNRGGRPEHFARSLDIGYIKRAKKPFVRATRKLMKELGADAKRTALVGDQIYTDVLCAGFLGITSIVVAPVSLKNPLIRIRYALEAPFRAAYRLRRRINGQDY